MLVLMVLMRADRRWAARAEDRGEAPVPRLPGVELQKCTSCTLCTLFIAFYCKSPLHSTASTLLQCKSSLHFAAQWALLIALYGIHFIAMQKFTLLQNIVALHPLFSSKVHGKKCICYIAQVHQGTPNNLEVNKYFGDDPMFYLVGLIGIC